MSYTFLNSDVPGEIITDGRHAGFEIECEGVYHTNVSRGAVDCSSCQVKGDGSLSHGLELVTFPAQRAKLEEVVKKHTEELKRMGCNISYRCGLHMHLDGRDIVTDPVKIARIFRTFYVFEPVLYAVIESGRKTNSFCRPIREIYQLDELPEETDTSEVAAKWFKVDKRRLEMTSPQYMSNVTTRYKGLNLNSLYYRGSIEFRYHHGSLNAKEMLMWADLLQHMVSYAVSDKYDFSYLKKIDHLSDYKKFEELMNLLEFDETKQQFWKNEIEKYNNQIILDHLRSEKKDVESSFPVDQTSISTNSATSEEANREDDSYGLDGDSDGFINSNDVVLSSSDPIKDEENDDEDDNLYW